MGLFGKNSSKNVKVPDIFLKAMAEAPEDATVMCMLLFRSGPDQYHNARFTTWKDDELRIVGDVKLPFTLLDKAVVEKYLDRSSYEARFYFRNYDYLIDDYLKRVESGDVDYDSQAKKDFKKNSKKYIKHAKL